MLPGMVSGWIQQQLSYPYFLSGLCWLHYQHFLLSPICRWMLNLEKPALILVNITLIKPTLYSSLYVATGIITSFNDRNTL